MLYILSPHDQYLLTSLPILLPQTPMTASHRDIPNTYKIPCSGTTRTHENSTLPFSSLRFRRVVIRLVLTLGDIGHMNTLAIRAIRQMVR